jgi:hypothetical protein
MATIGRAVRVFIEAPADATAVACAASLAAFAEPRLSAAA